MIWQVRRHGPGCWILNYHGRPDIVPAGMEALVAYDDNDLPCGYLLYECCLAGTGPRPWYTRDYLFLHSVWVCDNARGQGVFGRMAGKLRRLYPRTAIVGLAVDPTGAVQRFFSRCEHMPGRQLPVAD